MYMHNWKWLHFCTYSTWVSQMAKENPEKSNPTPSNTFLIVDGDTSKHFSLQKIQFLSQALVTQKISSVEQLLMVRRGCMARWQNLKNGSGNVFEEKLSLVNGSSCSDVQNWGYFVVASCQSSQFVPLIKAAWTLANVFTVLHSEASSFRVIFPSSTSFKSR